MRKKKLKVLFCEAPDRHEPKLKCGYPLPCPHHNFRKVIRIAVVVK